MIVRVLKSKVFLLWFSVTAGLSGYCYYLFFESPDKTAILPGTTTHGHHQIEMECSACHTAEKKKNVFTSSGVPSSACMKCHSEALAAFSDSHPIRKFKNPENIIFTSKIEATSCITCHREHNERVTGEMGVTIPNDFCAHCHEVTLENLPSHKNLRFNSCQTAGCHNYHDNTALSPSFLLKHYGEQKMTEDPKVPELEISQPCPDKWGSASSCAKCHDSQVHEFHQSKHGMRSVFKNLSPLTPELARIPMKKTSFALQMDCLACHQPNKPRLFASHDACIQCHDDNHTNNFKLSTHSKIWHASKGESGASCATCHLPRIESESGGYHVSHDNTANLRPNEKMIRSSCLHCHGLQFSMNALADPKLIESNFSQSPSIHHEGISWAVKTALDRDDPRIKEIYEYLKTLSKENTNNENQE